MAERVKMIPDKNAHMVASDKWSQQCGILYIYVTDLKITTHTRISCIPEIELQHNLPKKAWKSYKEV